jgi:hypothetical protein
MQLQQVFLQEHLEHVNLESLLNLYALLPYTFQVFYQDIKALSNLVLSNKCLDLDLQDMLVL